MHYLDVFEYNQHFVAMMNIINAARLNPPSKGHKHHIIPKCWFKKNNLPIDNSKDNLVLLTEEQHMKVHKLAAMCIIGSDMRSAMGFAVHRLHGSYRGMHHTEETRIKISEANKGKTGYWQGKHMSSDTRKKMSESQKCKQRSAETRRKISESKKNISDETRRRISESKKNISDETRRRISESQKGEKNHNYGKHFSEEHRRKLSESKKGEKNYNYGKHISADTRKKMSESHKGRTFSEEHRRKLREAWVRRRAAKKN